MQNYKLLIERRAETDIISIREYIERELKNRASAENIVRDIVATCRTLKSLPEWTPVKYSWKGYEVRYAHSHNYTIVYSSDKVKKLVRVHAVMCSRRNIEKVLREA